MDTSLIAGSFSRVLDQGYCDYCLKVGYPDEAVKAMLGAHINFKVEITAEPETSFKVTYSCPEVPPFNSEDVFPLNKTMSSDSLVFGGQGSTVKITQTGDNRLLGECQTPLLGSIEFREMYDAEGCHFTMVVKGESITDLWKREKE